MHSSISLLGRSRHTSVYVDLMSKSQTRMAQTRGKRQINTMSCSKHKQSTKIHKRLEMSKRIFMIVSGTKRKFTSGILLCISIVSSTYSDTAENTIHKPKSLGWYLNVASSRFTVHLRCDDLESDHRAFRNGLQTQVNSRSVSAFPQFH